jgi:protein gp37
MHNTTIGWTEKTWKVVTGCLNNCSYCVSGDTLLLTKEFRWKSIKDINVGDKLIGVKKDSFYHKYNESIVLKKFNKLDEVYEVEFQNGIKIKCSSSHKFLTPGARWRELKSFRIEDQVFCCVKPVANTETLKTVDIKGGFKENVRFLSLVDNAIIRKRNICGIQVFGREKIVSIKKLGYKEVLYDIQTSTGNYIANGIVSHNCYARRFDKEMKPTFHPNRLNEPLKLKEPSMIFVVNTGDLFGEWVQKEWIDKVLDVIRQCPQHTFQLLSKNPIRYRQFEYPDNVWLGTTITKQSEMLRASILSSIAYEGIKYISFEPLMGNINIVPSVLEGINWAIVGAETYKNSHTPRFEIEAKRYGGYLIPQLREMKIPIFIKSNMKWNEKVEEWPAI